MSEETKNTNQDQPLDTDNRKEFGLSSFSIDNRISVLVLMILIAIMGTRSYLNIPKEASPDVTVPNILVITTYPGVAPLDIENLITRKLEEELSNISDITTIMSSSAEGYSNINLEFNVDVDIDEAMQQVREQVDLAKAELPADAEEPIIEEINISEFPIMQVNVSGEYGLDELKDVAEDLQEKIEAMPQVLSVDLAGGLEREVQVDVDLAKMKYYGVSFGDIIAAIQNENVTVPGGSVDVGVKQFLLRVPGEYSNPADIEDIVITAPNDMPIYIRDVASVTFGHKERQSYAFLDGVPVITLSVAKRIGQNIIETTDAVNALIDQELPGMPPTTTVEITDDQSSEIRMMVSSLENNIISGLLLVIGVLLFFLGVRNSSFVGISIPLSMFMAFVILEAMGITMNMIVLFSLILALGMLVDNAIVVVENIYRYLEDGYDNITAAKKGTGEVALPIISGTATTLAAFFPIAFWPGIVGDFMSYLPITLIITLGSSLFVGLVINPVLCAVFMKLEKDESGKQRATLTRRGKIVLLGFGLFFLLLGLMSNWISWTMLLVLGFILYLAHEYLLKPAGEWWQRRGLNVILDRYEGILKWSLDHYYKIVGMAFGVLLFSFVIFGMFNSGVVFFPEDIPPPRLYAQVEAPAGTNVDFTKSIIDEIVSRVDQLDNPEDIETLLATSGAPIASGFPIGGGDTQNRGTVVLSFVDFQRRTGDTFHAMEQMREILPANIAGADITIEQQQGGPPTGPPINLEVSGNNIEELNIIADDLLQIIQNDPVYSKLDGLEVNLPEARPEIRIRVDREKAAMFGLTTFDVGNTVRQAINGVEASNFRDGNEEYDITVRLSDIYRNDLGSLTDLTVMAEEGRQIPLSEIATWEAEEGYGGINRKDQRRLITVMADVRASYNSNAVLAEVQQVVAPYLDEQLPPGFIVSWTGQNQEQEEAQEFLTNAFMIALFLMAFILISQFNSISKPFIVLTSVIMSISGVLYGLVLFSMPFGIIMTGIGVISLAGVVVNNAIVLIDYIDILRTRDKLNLYDALVQAGLIRFRPVILTAITTTLGLVPLAIGFNIDFIVLVNQPLEFFANFGQYFYWGGEQAAWWSPMAIAVICGLIFATVLTLILVPVMYYIIEKGRRKTNMFMFDTANPSIISSGNGQLNGTPKESEYADSNQ